MNKPLKLLGCAFVGFAAFVGVCGGLLTVLSPKPQAVSTPPAPVAIDVAEDPNAKAEEFFLWLSKSSPQFYLDLYGEPDSDSTYDELLDSRGIGMRIFRFLTYRKERVCVQFVQAMPTNEHPSRWFHHGFFDVGSSAALKPSEAFSRLAPRLRR